MPFRNLIAVLGVGLTLTACANLQTIERTTEIPDKIDSEKNPKEYKKQLGKGKAIHLDAQQRLVLATAQGYCAEPSPDALAAYAASLKLGVNVPGRESISADQSLLSNTASIGLRTQSITLMRDSLYRICEASHNGDLKDTEVVAFLKRSQDLTAVVLAIEQLTGTIAAKQVVLLPSAKTIEEEVEEKKAVVKDAQLNLDNAKSEKDKAEITQNQKADLLQKCKVKDTGQCLKEETEKLQAEISFSEAKKKINVANAELKVKKKELKYAKDLQEMIRTGKGFPVFQNKPLSDVAAMVVAEAVKEMVTHVVNKPYIRDVCLSELIRSEEKRAEIVDGGRKSLLAIQNETDKKQIELEQEKQRLQADRNRALKLLEYTTQQNSENNKEETQRQVKEVDETTNPKFKKIAKKMEEGKDKLTAIESALQTLEDAESVNTTDWDSKIKSIYQRVKQKLIRIEKLTEICKNVIYESAKKNSDDESKVIEGPSE